MSLLLQTFLCYGRGVEELSRLARKVCCGELHPEWAMIILDLSPEQKRELQRVILTDPEQVELCAQEIGLSLPELDRMKARLLAAA